MESTGNIYMTTVMISKRAKQIATRKKEELDVKLAEFSAHTDDLEEVIGNQERVELSKSYEKQPKPTLIATQEFMAGEIICRIPEEAAILPS